MVKGVEVAAFTVTKEQALDCQVEVAKGTPVDVGTARSNWRISVGSPLTGKIGAYFPFMSRYGKVRGSGGSIGEGANLAGVVAQGRARLAGYKGGSIYISNALPYIGRLEDGYSPQNSGFINRAVMIARQKTEAKIKPIFDKEFSK